MAKRPPFQKSDPKVHSRSNRADGARGIAPDLLVSQVRNTMPYLFDSGFDSTPLGMTRAARVILPHSTGVIPELSHFDYFSLCLSAHFLTVGTPVPTDVDNQIRKKLWSPSVPLETALEMAHLVLDSRRWPHELFSPRYQRGAQGTEFERESVSGHLGEWFTVAAGAYAALGQYPAPEAQEVKTRILAEITDEVKRHGDIFASLWKAGDGIGCLVASASLAHNLGDLDRVIDQWELTAEDPLRKAHYKLGALPFDSNGKLRHSGRLWAAGELYKSPIDAGSMAAENHRHFPLRKPRVLRTRPEFRLPNGPFYDDWGDLIWNALVPGSEERAEVLEALVEGWKRLPGSVGYGRALQRIFEKEGFTENLATLKDIKPYRKVLETPRPVFERRWNEGALRELEEIPSRAG